MSWKLLTSPLSGKARREPPHRQRYRRGRTVWNRPAHPCPPLRNRKSSCGLSCLTCWGWRTVDRYPSEPYPSRIWPPSGPLTLRAIRIRPLAMTQMFRTSATQKPSAQRKSTRGSGRWTRQREPQKPPLPLPTRNSRHSFYSTRQRSNPTQVRNWSTSP